MNILDQSCLKERSSIRYFEAPEISALRWIRHGFLTRRGGTSPSPYDSLNLGFRTGDHPDHVKRNAGLIGAAFCFDPGNFIFLDQKHSDRILTIKDSPASFASVLEYDAVITRTPKFVLAIRTADCIPILIADRKRKVIAAVHAGRQGAALRIVIKVLRKMKEEFGSSPADLSIALGPSIGACCYEIDDKVFMPEWEPFSVRRGPGKWMVDLSRINIAQMKEEGLQESQISRIDLCTKCHKDLFFSYRGDGQTGRQVSFIGIMD